MEAAEVPSGRLSSTQSDEPSVSFTEDTTSGRETRVRPCFPRATLGLAALARFGGAEGEPRVASELPMMVINDVLGFDGDATTSGLDTSGGSFTTG